MNWGEIGNAKVVLGELAPLPFFSEDLLVDLPSNCNNNIRKGGGGQLYKKKRGGGSQSRAIAPRYR